MFSREIQINLGERGERELADEEDIRQWRKEWADEKREPYVPTLGDYRRAFWKAARRFVHQRRCMDYWAESNYGGMSKPKQEGILNELKVKLDMARERLSWAIRDVKKRKGECDGRQRDI